MFAKLKKVIILLSYAVCYFFIVTILFQIYTAGMVCDYSSILCPGEITEGQKSYGLAAKATMIIGLIFCIYIGIIDPIRRKLFNRPH